MTTFRRPVFVVGCPRSGTTLLYHMLLSAGGFAVYRAETHVFNLMVPRFGDLRVLKSRTRLIDEWLTTEYFRRTGLQAAPLRARILAECGNGGDFLQIIMESIARQHGVERWAECTPEHLLYLREIKRTLPQAQVLHIIRDGRDVALSLEKQGWVRPQPWDRKHSLLVAGLYWEWIVQKGRRLGARIAPDYMEVRFEDLVQTPQDTLSKISAFIGHDLDYREIQRTGIGSVSQPNTSFERNSQDAPFNPVGRWKGASQEDIAELEPLLRPSLLALGYPVTMDSQATQRWVIRSMRTRYRALFESRHWLKSHTLLGRWLVNASLLRQPIGSEVQRV